MNPSNLTPVEHQVEKLLRNCTRCANQVTYFGLGRCLVGKTWEACGGKYFRARQGGECANK